MPFISAMSALFLTVIAGACFGSAEVGFLLGIMSAGITFHYISHACQSAVFPVDNPAPIMVELPPTQVYSTIKMLLSNYHYRHHRWYLSPANREELKLHAYCQWIDHSHRDDPFPINLAFDENGQILRQIILNIHVYVDPVSELTAVHLSWQIESPLYRGDCHIIQRETTDLIAAALAQKESSRSTDLPPPADGISHEYD